VDPHRPVENARTVRNLYHAGSTVIEPEEPIDWKRIKGGILFTSTPAFALETASRNENGRKCPLPSGGFARLAASDRTRVIAIARLRESPMFTSTLPYFVALYRFSPISATCTSDNNALN